MRTAVAAPSQEPTDDCNWAPLRLTRTHDVNNDYCGKPCVQEGKMAIFGGAMSVEIHRCEEHRVEEEKLR